MIKIVGVSEESGVPLCTQNIELREQVKASYDNMWVLTERSVRVSRVFTYAH